MTADCLILKMAILCYFHQRLLTKLIKIMCTKFSGIKFWQYHRNGDAEKIVLEGNIRFKANEPNEGIQEAFSCFNLNGSSTRN